jgi:hypothetical protein
MMSFLPPRLRHPAWAVLIGAALGVAFWVHGGPWAWSGLLAFLGGVGRAVLVYRMGREDTDEGALAADRADERQQLVSVRSHALAGHLATAGAFIGMCAGIAARASWWWPFAVVLALAGFGFLFGLSTYGYGEPEPEPGDDSAAAGQPARSPVQG